MSTVVGRMFGVVLDTARQAGVARRTDLVAQWRQGRSPGPGAK